MTIADKAQPKGYESGSSTIMVDGELCRLHWCTDTKIDWCPVNGGECVRDECPSWKDTGCRASLRRVR